MEPVWDTGSVARDRDTPDRQLHRNFGAFAREALYIEGAPQERYPFHHSQKTERVAPLQRFLDLETHSIIFYAKFYGVIGRSQVNVYAGGGRMFSNVVKTFLH